MQPKVHFPPSMIDRPRAFNVLWYTKFPWMDNSVSRDAVFCFACRYFSIGHEKEQAFTLVGFRDWKYALGKRGVITRHDMSSIHKTAMSALETSSVEVAKC